MHRALPLLVAVVAAATFTPSAAQALPASDEVVRSIPTVSGQSTTLDDVSAYAFGAHGLVVARQGRSLTYYGSDGAVRWTTKASADITGLSVISAAGRDWVLAETASAVQVYDVRATRRVTPIASIDLTGGRLVSTSSRAMIVGDGTAPRLINPSDGSTTVVELPSGDAAVAATADGVLVTRDGTVQGLWSENGGWSRTGVAPKGANGAQPKLIGFGASLIALNWDGVVTVNRMTDGATLSTGKASGSPVFAADGSVVIVGNVAFDVTSGTRTELPEGFTATSAFEGVIYGSSKEAGSAAIDARSGKPLATAALRAVPTDFGLWRVAVLGGKSLEKGTYSVTLAPLKPLDR